MAKAKRTEGQSVADDQQDEQTDVELEEAPEEVEDVEEVEQDIGDYLMWVGSMHYPTVADYIQEARERGCCKRFGKLPKGLIVGQSRVFLAHDDGSGAEEGFVFGYFVPVRLEVIVSYVEDIPPHLVGKVTPVMKADIEHEAERECGFREEGGTYYVGVPRAEGASYRLGSLVEFAQPRRLAKFDLGRKHFRGTLRIDYADALMDAGKSKCIVPPSQKPTPKAKPWTATSNAALVEVMEGAVSKAATAQQLAYKSGHSKGEILRHFRALLAKEDKEE